MKKPKSPILRVILGIFFIILGVIGLFLPILQGILFILIGLALLGVPVKKYLKKFTKKKKK